MSWGLNILAGGVSWARYAAQSRVQRLLIAGATAARRVRGIWLVDGPSDSCGVRSGHCFSPLEFELFGEGLSGPILEKSMQHAHGVFQRLSVGGIKPLQVGVDDRAVVDT